MKRKGKKKGAFSIALTYAGCMLGAGFVSGQELWQYFGAYGKKGVLSLVLSFILLGVFTLILLLLSRKTGKTAMDDLILKADLPVVKDIIGILTAVIIFSNVSIMIAGIGALVEEACGIARPVVNLIVTILIGIFSYFGISGMMAVFDFLVPVLVIATLALCGVRIGNAGISGIDLSEKALNPLLGGCGLACINYAAMNFYGVLTVFPPIGKETEKKRTFSTALILGTMLLILSGLAVILALSTSETAVLKEVPMQEIAGEMGAVPDIVISVMLTFAMFGVGVSYQVSTMSYLEGRFVKFMKKGRSFVLLMLLAAAYLLSLFGFGDLISLLYPLFGYFGMLLMLLIGIRYAGTFFSLKHEKRLQ